MTLTPEAEIAQFLRRLKYILFAGLVGWVVWLLAPILTPFVLALALAGWATRWWTASRPPAARA